MSERTESIRKKLQEMFTGEDQVFQATVKEVNEEEFTCTVIFDDELEYTDVRLRSVIDSEKQGFCFIPKQESLVQVGRIANSEQLFVALFSEVDKIILTTGNLELTVDADMIELKKGEKLSVLVTEEELTINADQSMLKQTAGGFTMVRSGEGLKKILQDLITAITQLTVPTGVGPSGVPINTAAFQAINNRLNNFLEG
ncbi:hypothetical protein [uncultured Draconibacterium sp.]|uniref:hypothetical protein n=1 Tax=uncultured Draconibacterium sp. TaxID=1573823 RepID=UPI0025E24E12|nr:hypothetical protein [uncultured Draconibacterium sp.]